MLVSQPAGGALVYVAPMPRAYNGAQPSQPSTGLPGNPYAPRFWPVIGLRLRGPLVLPRLAPAPTQPGSLSLARSLLLPFTAFDYLIFKFRV